MSDKLLNAFNKPSNYLINSKKSVNNPKLYSSRIPPKMNFSDNNINIVVKPKNKK